MHGRILDNPRDDSPVAIVRIRERADPRIANLARWKDALQTATAQRSDEDVGELVIGGILGSVVLGVRAAKLREHRIDDDRELFPGVGGSSQRLVTAAHRRPVQSMEVAVVEAVAHRLPHLVESGPMRLHRRSVRLDERLAVGWPRVQGGKAPEGQDVPACNAHGADDVRPRVDMLLSPRLVQGVAVAPSLRRSVSPLTTRSAASTPVRYAPCAVEKSWREHASPAKNSRSSTGAARTVRASAWPTSA